MPTDEERREVAAKFRDFERLRTVFKESYVCAFSGALGVGYMDWEHICARLADLIEPTLETCELELTWGGHTNAHVRTYECSRCGKSCDSVWGEDYEFCPYCGRRVEYADE